jgi:branched-chain amino acid transport system substrate-binding protein
MNHKPESKISVPRRRLVTGTAAAASVGGFFGPWRIHHAWAQAAQAKPLVIGLTMDASGQYGASGGMERLGAMMAIKEFNDKGGVLGRRIEAIHMDTETTPATGSRVAERMISRNDAAFLIGAVHSGVANAISQVAQKYGCIFLNTNSSSPTESGKDCHRVKFVWDGNGTNFALAIVKNSIKVNGKDWVLMTNDYVWGHNTSKATRGIVEANGGKIVEELLVPQNTRDFSSFLLKLQQLKPNVVATAIGGDDIKALRQQVVQLGLQKNMAWVNNQ